MILLARQADLFRRGGRQQRRLDDRLARHLDGGQRRALLLVLVHQPGEQFLVERAPVDPDAHRLAVADRHLDDGAELLVLLLLEADIAGIDAIFGERLGAGRMVGQQPVADIVEVADQRHVDAQPVEPLANAGHSRRALVAVDRDAHDLRAGTGAAPPLAPRSRRYPPCRCWSSTGRRPAAPPPTITPPTSTATERRRSNGVE